MAGRMNMVAAATLTALLLASCTEDASEPTSDGLDRGGSTTSNASDADGDPPSSTTQPEPPYRSPIYGELDHWLCHPEASGDACDIDLATTTVERDGSQIIEQVTADPDAPVDCFYVYPTVSEDPEGNSDLDPGDAEFRVIRAQIAQFSTVCRVFAPVYRQITRAALGGQADDIPDRALAYSDVDDAWAHYLANDNDGRGVVLIGHSQGAGHLRELLTRRIDPEPAERGLLVSAILLGTTARTPTEADTGAHFEHLPPCSAPDQVGCIISFSTYADDAPPGDDGFFAGVRDTGDERAICTNPVSLAGGSALADSVLTTNPGREPDVTTPFVRYVGIAEIECVESGIFHYLEVRYQASEEDRWPPELGGRISPQWGLHLIDGNIALGDLVRVVEQQGDTHATG